jgi:hypothetical protein
VRNFGVTKYIALYCNASRLHKLLNPSSFEHQGPERSCIRIRSYIGSVSDLKALDARQHHWTKKFVLCQKQCGGSGAVTLFFSGSGSHSSGFKHDVQLSRIILNIPQTVKVPCYNLLYNNFHHKKQKKNYPQTVCKLFSKPACYIPD